MKAGLGSNHFYVWRSLLWSKEILESGLLWKIGDVKSIKIFEENWVPSMYSRVYDPLVPWEREETVSSLINDGSWNFDLISTSFNSYLAREIIKILLLHM